MAELELASLQAALEGIGSPWVAGTTSVSELSSDAKKQLLGVPLLEGKSEAEIKREIEANRSSARAAMAGAIGAAAAIDWRNNNGNYVTPVKNQGGCGSCVAFGSVAALESRLRIQRGDPNLAVDMSEAQLFYCHARSEGRTCGGNTGGWWPHNAMEALKTKGVTDETHYPYTAGDQACSGLLAGWESAVLKITDYVNLSGNAAAIKEHISTKGPITACFVVFEDFFNYRSGVYRHVSGGIAGGHCVCIVGYNDAGGYWIAKNSWGTSWGDGGFFCIAYGECNIESYDGVGSFGVQGIAETGWLSNSKVIGLWTNNGDRNAWVYLQGAAGNIGWRKISADNDNVHTDMLSQLSTAKILNAPVNVLQDNSVIKEIYL
jgi:C1A family cysteine protease